ncbi:MAG: helix-turn-helix domain-containing protein [Gammaproteobacteria bacterium]|nr:helix-turn-helix domain-containing protein [Gammaproteobacteria bacterium]MCP5195390.1 helix-turn-helix domain-containing protein [Gammaproteobacteria bacterium]
MNFGDYIRRLRRQRYQINRRYSVQRVAERIGLDPSYLHQVECGEAPPPEEKIILQLAADFGEDSDILLALAGKVASDVHETITRRPVLFSELIRGLDDLSDKRLATLVHEVRNDQW